MLFLCITSCHSICYVQLNAATVKQKKTYPCHCGLSTDSPQLALQQSFLHTKYIKIDPTDFHAVYTDFKCGKKTALFLDSYTISVKSRGIVFSARKAKIKLVPPHLTIPLRCSTCQLYNQEDNLLFQNPSFR